MKLFPTWRDHRKAANDPVTAGLPAAGSDLARPRSMYSQGPAASVQHVEREAQIRNRLGLHARTASDFVRCACSFRSDVQLVVDGRRHSARRVMDVLLAHLDPGCRFTIVADGPDAEEAATALEGLLARFAELDHATVEGIRAYRMRRVDFVED